MRVLLDEQLPRHLAREIAGHDVSTVQQCGWAGLQNGELLRVAADAGFDVLVTADRSLQFQQNLSQSRLGVILLVAPSNTLEDLCPLVPSTRCYSRSAAPVNYCSKKSMALNLAIEGCVEVKSLASLIQASQSYR